MTISPGYYDFTIFKGETFTQPVIFSNSCGVPIDLTGATALFSAKYSLTDAQPFLELSTSDGAIVIDGATGRITLNASQAVTDALTKGVGIYNLQITLGAYVFYLLRGKLIIQEMVEP